MSIYDITVKGIFGEEISMAEYKDQAMLIVNTASNWGFTPQLKDLEDLYKKYQDRGFVVLGFPCNQFGNQEPGTNEEIKTFCDLSYGVSFPMFEKSEVNGENENPLYTFLKSKKGGLLGSAIKWNFTKFLVDKQGNVVKRYAPATKPLDIEKDIQKLL